DTASSDSVAAANQLGAWNFMSALIAILLARSALGDRQPADAVLELALERHRHLSGRAQKRLQLVREEIETPRSRGTRRVGEERAAEHFVCDQLAQRPLDRPLTHVDLRRSRESKDEAEPEPRLKLE